MTKLKQMNKESENKFLVVTVVVVIVSGLIGIAAMTLDSYATIALKQSQEPSENTTGRPGLQFQRQPSEAPEDGSESERHAQAEEELSNAAEPEDDTESQRKAQAEEELTNAAEQQEDENNAAGLKDEQIRDVQEEEEEEDGNENGGGNAEQVVIDKAPVVISGDNVFIIWFNDQNTPNNNSEVLFRSSADGGVTFADKINLSNTTTADSINAEIAPEGNNVVITWWERNATGEEPVVRASADNGATFGPMLTLATNGPIGQATE